MNPAKLGALLTKRPLLLMIFTKRLKALLSMPKLLMSLKTSHKWCMSHKFVSRTQEILTESNQQTTNGLVAVKSNLEEMEKTVDVVNRASTVVEGLKHKVSRFKPPQTTLPSCWPNRFNCIKCGNRSRTSRRIRPWFCNCCWWSP